MATVGCLPARVVRCSKSGSDFHWHPGWLADRATIKVAMRGHSAKKASVMQTSLFVDSAAPRTLVVLVLSMARSHVQMVPPISAAFHSTASEGSWTS